MTRPRTRTRRRKLEPRAQVTERLRRMARRRRDALVARLGGACVRCHASERLEFDHPRGRSWHPKRVSRWRRIKLYELDADAGNLRLLCRRCNARDGGRRGAAQKSEGAEQRAYAEGYAAHARDRREEADFEEPRKLAEFSGLEELDAPWT